MTDNAKAGDGGSLHLKAGDGGHHGNGAPLIITGGTFKGGDGGSVVSPGPEPASTEKRWFEKPLGLIAIGVLVTVSGGGILRYLGWI